MRPEKCSGVKNATLAVAVAGCPDAAHFTRASAKCRPAGSGAIPGHTPHPAMLIF